MIPLQFDRTLVVRGGTGLMTLAAARAIYMEMTHKKNSEKEREKKIRTRWMRRGQ